MKRQASRRAFLKFAAASAAAALGGAPIDAAAADHQESSSAPKKRRRIKIAVKYGMISQGATVLEKFQLLRELGYDGVEMDSPSEIPLEEIVNAKQATGIEIPGVVDSVHWKQPLSDPDPQVRAAGRQALETALRECRQLGGTSVLLVPAVVNKHVSYADAYARSQEEIRKVLPLAAELRIHIAIENVWNNFLLSPLEAARYIDEFESPWVGWHFDIGNVVTYGWPEQWIRTLGKRILKLDVKDYSRKRRDEQGLWKGFDIQIGDVDSDCDWPAVRTALAAIGYRGWACAEVAGGNAARLREIAQQMDRVLGNAA